MSCHFEERNLYCI